MTPKERFQRVEDLFRVACDMPTEKRSAFLRESCAGHTSILQQVTAMLDADGVDVGVVDRPAFGMATDLSDPSLRIERSQAPMPGHIGPYRILRVIGEGGMGVVYEAEQESPKRRVALKIVRDDIVTHSLLRRFRQETQVLGQLQHHGIAQIYDARVAQMGDAQRPFFAMELVNGESLLKHADTHGLNTRERLALVAKVCDALHHAHSRGVVHRDLKPENILVEASDQRVDPARSSSINQLEANCGTPKVLDFGVARLTDTDSLTMTQGTYAGQLVGTIPYMSPEQAAGDARDIDPRSDVYSLGVITFQLLSGRLPYEVEGRLVHEAVRIIREDDPSRLSSVDRVFGGDIDTIVARALEKEKERRYQSAHELAADIRRYLNHEPIHARPVSALYQFRKFARRNKAFVLSVAIALAAMVLATSISVWKTIDATVAQQSAETQGRLARQRAHQAQRAANRAILAASHASLEMSDPRTAHQRLQKIPEAQRGFAWSLLNARLDDCMALIEEREPIVAVGSNTDASLIITVTHDGIIRWWDPWRSRVTTEYRLDSDPIAIATLAPDVSTLVTVSASDPHRIDLWSGTDGTHTKALGTVELVPVQLAISNDSRFVAATYIDNSMQIWSTSDGRDRWTTHGTEKSRSLAFSPEGDSIVRSSLVGAFILDARTGNTVQHLALPNAARSVAMTRNGQRLIAGGINKLISIIDPETGEILDTWTGHLGAIVGLAVNRQETHVASVGTDGLLRLWELETGKPITTYTAASTALRSVQFSPDGSMIFAGCGPNTVRIWSAHEEPPSILPGHGSYVYSTAFTPDGARVVSGSWDGDIRIWNVQTGMCEDVLHTDDSFCSAIAISPDGTLIASAHFVGAWQQSRIRLWNAQSGALVHEFNPSGLRGEITDLSFSPGGRRLLASRRDGSLYLINLRDEVLTRSSTGFPASSHAHSATWSPDGSTVVTGGANGDINLSSATTGHLIRTLKGHTQAVASCRFLPDGIRLVSAAADETVRVWNVNTGECLAVLRGHWADVYAVAVSPDGSLLASGAADAGIRLWDLNDYEEILELRGHTDYVHSLAFSPDGSTVVSGSGDGTVRLWRTQPVRDMWSARRSR